MPASTFGRFLICGICALGALLPWSLSGQEPDRPPELESLPYQERMLLTHASMFYIKDDVRGAIKVIQQRLPQNASSVHVLSYLAEMYERLGDDSTAVVYYTRALSSLADTANRHYYNLPLKRARAFLRMRLYREAVSDFRKALTHPRYGPHDAGIHFEMAGPYAASGHYRHALESYVIAYAASGDPEPLDSIKSIASWPVELISAAEAEAFARVAEMAPSLLSQRTVESSSSPEALFAERYFQFSDLLADKQFHRAAKVVDSLGMAILYSPAYELFQRQRYNDVVTAVAEAGNRRPLAEVPFVLRVRVQELLATSHLYLGDLDHVVAVIEDLRVHREKQEVWEMLQRLARLTFAYVSFDLRTGHPIAVDPADFVGPEISATSPADNEQGRQAMRYGEVSDAEDFANVLAFFLSSSAAEKKLPIYLLQAGNPELAVKCFLHHLSWLGPVDWPDDEFYGISLLRLHFALQRTDEHVTLRTQEAYELAFRLNLLMLGIDPWLNSH